MTTSSQPVRLPMATTAENFPIDDASKTSEAKGEGSATKDTEEAVDSIWSCITRGSFTQPAKFEELIVGTQVPCTPGASQVCSIAGGGEGVDRTWEGMDGW